MWDGDFYSVLPAMKKRRQFRAHRVGWRLEMLNALDRYVFGSEPTVWDGDHKDWHIIHEVSQVPSPPCGMVTFLPLEAAFFAAIAGSEPTVWDGGMKSDNALKPSGVGVLSPLGGMETRGESLPFLSILLVPSPLGGMVTFAPPPSGLRAGRRLRFLSPLRGMETCRILCSPPP